MLGQCKLFFAALAFVVLCLSPAAAVRAHSVTVDPNNRNAGVTVVPEPATIVLLGTGLACIGATMRKRRKKVE